jgi:hypothetical protein
LGVFQVGALRWSEIHVLKVHPTAMAVILTTVGII